MKTKTLPVLIKKVAYALGNGNVILHDPTDENKIGQSGVHTFVDDILDIVDKYEHPRLRYKYLVAMILNLDVD